METIQNFMRVRVTEAAKADRQVRDPDSLNEGTIIDMTLDEQSAWVMFPQRGAKSLWHKSELEAA